MSVRAEYRRQAKQDQKQDKVYHLTGKQLQKFIDDAAEKKGFLAFREKMNEYVAAYMEVFTIAQLGALRRMFPNWGMKRNDRLVALINEELAKVSAMVVRSSYDPSELSKWCGLNGLDSEKVFGIAKRFIQAQPDMDEDGSPVIYLEVDDG